VDSEAKANKLMAMVDLDPIESFGSNYESSQSTGKPPLRQELVKAEVKEFLAT